MVLKGVGVGKDRALGGDLGNTGLYRLGFVFFFPIVFVFLKDEGRHGMCLHVWKNGVSLLRIGARWEAKWYQSRDWS